MLLVNSFMFDLGYDNPTQKNVDDVREKEEWLVEAVRLEKKMNMERGDNGKIRTRKERMR